MILWLNSRSESSRRRRAWITLWPRIVHILFAPLVLGTVLGIGFFVSMADRPRDARPGWGRIRRWRRRAASA